MSKVTVDRLANTSEVLIEINDEDAYSFDRTTGFTIDSGAWNGRHLVLGSYHIWVDSTGDLRIKSSAPTNDTDGTIIGSQS